MNRRTKRFCSLVLAAFFIIAALFIPTPAKANATETKVGQRYNIMLVIDGSGSLISESTTDPDGMRYELIDDLLGVLEDDGHHIGAIVFSGNSGTGTSDEAMQSGILCNTGMISLDQAAPNGRLPKDYISQAIREADVDRYAYGKTDIGTALLVAERELQKAHEANGLEPLVFLFTDGVTDITNPDVLAKAEENLTTATWEMSQNGIRLFGAFLNKGGRLPSDQINGIVCAANSISVNSKEFLKSCVEITDADSCHAAVNTLLQFLGYIDSVPPEPVVGTIEDEFTIPGIGIEEMNIRLYSYNGEDLPPMTVELEMPDGTKLDETTLNSLCRSSRTIRVYKLITPMGGTWKLKVTVPENNNIAYVYSRIFSKLVDSELVISPDVSSLHVNATANFTATLSQNGTAITDPLAYSGYSCNLEIVNLADNSIIETTEIVGNGANFVHTATLKEYGSFAARVVFKCDNFEVASDFTEYTLYNQAPTSSSPVVLKLTTGLFQKKSTDVNLLDYVNDPEDEKNLSIALQNVTCENDAYTFNGSTLTLVNKLIGTSSLDFTVTDSQGATADLRIEVRTRNVTVWFILLFVFVVVVIVAVVVISGQWLNKFKPTGELSVAFSLELRGETKSFDLDLPMPGKDAPGKITLYALLMKRLHDDSERLMPGITCEDVKDALSHSRSQLENVQLTKVITRSVGKPCGGIKVTYGKKSSIMPGKRNVEISAGELDISLIYSRRIEDEEVLFDDDLDFGSPAKNDKSSKKQGRSDFADFDIDF